MKIPRLTRMLLLPLLTAPLVAFGVSAALPAQAATNPLVWHLDGANSLSAVRVIGTPGVAPTLLSPGQTTNMKGPRFPLAVSMLHSFRMTDSLGNSKCMPGNRQITLGSGAGKYYIWGRCSNPVNSTRF